MKKPGDTITQHELTNLMALETIVRAARRTMVRRFDNDASIEPGDLTLDDGEADFPEIVCATNELIDKVIDDAVREAKFEDLFPATDKSNPKIRKPKERKAA